MVYFYQLLHFTFTLLCHSVFKVHCLADTKSAGGDEEDRTPDPLLARQVLSQLSYTPTGKKPKLISPSKLNNVIKDPY